MGQIKAVIGCNYGDEGKGLMTDYFANIAMDRGESCVVVCNNGGAQRGHTVVTPNGERHVFHHFGSGTLAGADTFLSPYFIVNPMIFISEYHQLKRHTKVIVSPDCLCSTPYDMMANQILEESRGENKHGSCGVGIWETVVRNGKSVGQMANMSDYELVRYLTEIQDYYIFDRLSYVPVSSSWLDLFINKDLLSHYVSDFRIMVAGIEFNDIKCIKNFNNIIFENGQGLLLDQNSEDKIHSTPSKTGSSNIYDMLNAICYDDLVELCYVTRTYMTRHGEGSFATECPVEDINPLITDKTNIWNKHQGAIRYGILDFDDLYRRCEQDALVHENVKMSIAMTHINEFDNVFNENKNRITYASYTEDRTGVTFKLTDWRES